jgi:hypothetical protein
MKKYLLVMIILLGCPSVGRADLFPLGETWSGTFSTYDDTGTLTDADSTPTVQAFIGSSGTAIASATVTNVSTGFYRYTLVMSSGNGFALGNSYSMQKTATVDSVTQKDTIADGIYLLEAPSTAGYLITDISADGVDLIWDEAMAELAQATPSATPAMRALLAALYMAIRNKVDVTSSVKEFHNDAGTVVFKKSLSDDGTTFTEAEAVAGP